MSKELKCCPFCGGEVIMSNEAIDATREVYNFHCHTCDMVTFYDFPNDREKAIEQWNTRKPIDRNVEQLEEEKDVAYADFDKYVNDYELDLDSDYDDLFHKGIERAIDVIRKGGVE